MPSWRERSCTPSFSNSSKSPTSWCVVCPKKTVEFPDNQSVTLAKMREGLLQAGAIRACSGRPVFEDALTTGYLEGVLLQVERVLDRSPVDQTGKFRQ